MASNNPSTPYLLFSSFAAKEKDLLQAIKNALQKVSILALTNRIFHRENRIDDFVRPFRVIYSPSNC